MKRLPSYLIIIVMTAFMMWCAIKQVEKPSKYDRYLKQEVMYKQYCNNIMWLSKQSSPEPIIIDIDKIQKEAREARIAEMQEAFERALRNVGLPQRPPDMLYRGYITNMNIPWHGGKVITSPTNYNYQTP